ncbi:hypothetical protein [Flavobacterium sp.]|uniref:hypothetical protein n=1 Tax=Flavobacterium sp. TaxID=239 RepID=UPI00286E46B2|nr:hypothetical protein [Flavobacterium sp.]
MKLQLSLLLFLICNCIFSQEEVPFKIRYQDYIKGDLTFIANTIVNRNEKGNTNESYNKLDEKSKLNDEFKMSYIDIDDDKSTFSSSSATYKSQNNKREVLFAGLYWSATYKYPIGNKEKEVFTGSGQRESNFNEIKIKTPGSQSYTTIKGDVIFDGFGKKNYTANAPYTCFSDITKLVQSNPNGEYIVANIRATEGSIEGGVSGGWVLYFVYQDETIPAKYISLYDGFAYVYNKPIEINFLNFQTPKSGDISGKIVMAALEGDTKIDGDNIRIKNELKQRYFNLSSKNRLEQNFFNSQITIENEPFLDRNPASLNTLGFDALLLSLNNTKNTIIPTQAIQTSLKIASVGDKFYLFSAGFVIDVEEEFYKKNKKEKFIEDIKSKLVVTENKKNRDEKKALFMEEMKKEAAIESSKPIVIEEQKSTKNTIKGIKTTVKTIYTASIDSWEEKNENQEINTFLEVKEKKENTSRKPIDIIEITIKSDVSSGYYLVANVFSISNNNLLYRNFLKKRNMISNYFINPENNYFYVYLKYSDSLEEITSSYNSNLNNTFFDDYWILNVNN